MYNQYIILKIILFKFNEKRIYKLNYFYYFVFIIIFTILNLLFFKSASYVTIVMYSIKIINIKSQIISYFIQFVIYNNFI